MFKKKVGAIIAAVALAGGIGVAAAGAAEAQLPYEYRIQHTADAPRGLGGNIGFQRSGGFTDTLPEGYNAYGYMNSGNEPRNIRAGGGYCVWEELFYSNNNTNDYNSYTKIGNFNWGKGFPSGSPFQLEGWKRMNQNQGHGPGMYSKLRVYAC